MVCRSLFERDRKICLPCAVNRRVRPSPHALMEHLAPATPSAKSHFLGLSAIHRPFWRLYLGGSGFSMVLDRLMSVETPLDQSAAGGKVGLCLVARNRLMIRRSQ